MGISPALAYEHPNVQKAYIYVPFSARKIERKKKLWKKKSRKLFVTVKKAGAWLVRALTLDHVKAPLNL